MAFTLCSSQAIIRKAGKGANTTIIASGAALQDWSEQADGFICTASRNNWVDTYATANADVKGVLTEAASNLAAIYVVNYDMASYASRIEAEDSVNILRDAALRGISVLRDKKQQDFISNA
jgi:hypothetical protein